MAKIENRQPQTGMEAALAFSRKLPQIGVPPEISFHTGARQIADSLAIQTISSAWEIARAKAMRGKK